MQPAHFYSYTIRQNLLAARCSSRSGSFPFVRIVNMMKARRGVFGGTAGIWLLRKKLREQKGDAPATVALPADSRSSSKSTKDSADERVPSPSKNGSTWIGWDDVRERPIYDGHSTTSTKNDDSDASVGLPPSMSNGGKSHTPKELLIKTKNIATKGRRGVFVVRKHHFVPVTETRNSPTSDESSMSSYVHQHKRICIQSSSSSKSSARGKSIETDRKNTGSYVDTVFNDITNNNGPSKPNKKSKDGSKLSQESDSYSIFDFDKHQQEVELTEVRQPGYQTTLSVARAFFAQLDSDHTLLTLEGVSCCQESCSATKQSEIKTTRGKLPPKVAQAQYRKYCAVCSESKVKPLPIERFLEQRSTFFRSGDVFDGMFDE
jgi:hypothetical protein